MIQNPFNYSVQINEIYASVTRDSNIRVYQEENRTVLPPLGAAMTIGRLRLLATKNDKVTVIESV
jgi:hypothetical protein